MKKALKKWITELLMALGGLAIFITFLSVIPDLFESNYPTQEHRQQYFNFLFQVMQFVILTIPLASLVEAIIMEYQLFSKNLTVRRAINLIIGICICLCGLNIFDFFSKDFRSLITILFLTLCPVGALIACIIEDRKKKKDIYDINNRLSQLNEDNKEQ